MISVIINIFVVSCEHAYIHAVRKSIFCDYALFREVIFYENELRQKVRYHIINYTEIELSSNIELSKYDIYFSLNVARTSLIFNRQAKLILKSLLHLW